jgi:hypothetical protein
MGGMGILSCQTHVPRAPRAYPTVGALDEGREQQTLPFAPERIPPMPPEPRAEKQLNPDAELARSFGLGCLVLFIAFLLLSGAVYFFWTR